MARVVICDEVRELLTTSAVERIMAQREHTELTCIVCHRTVTPEAPDTVSVIVRFDQAGTVVVNYAHASCASSHVDRTTALVAPAARRQTYWAMLRRQAFPAAALVWEAYITRLDSEGVEQTVEFSRDEGFAPSDAGVEDVTGPVLRGWVLTSHGDGLLLRHGRRDRLAECSEIATAASAEWLDAARDQRRCLLVVGETLGLERRSIPRINAMLADGRAVATVVLAKIAR